MVQANVHDAKDLLGHEGAGTGIQLERLAGVAYEYGGCIAIIDLNLVSFGDDAWTAEIRTQLASIRTSLAALYIDARTREDKLGRESARKGQFAGELAGVTKGLKGRNRFTDADIENLAIRLQKALWKFHDVYGKQAVPTSPKEILDPARALRLIGYHVADDTPLGQHMVGGQLLEVAGEINQDQEIVSISPQFEVPIRNFTTAHELGHALLHRQAVLHRDLPLDGSKRPTDPVERQADRFATHYLMPQKLLTKSFRQMFLTIPFCIDDDTAFALIQGPAATVRQRYRTMRQLSRFLASTDSYNGKRVEESLADFFGVSVEAMAIRLEELKLIEY